MLQDGTNKVLAPIVAGGKLPVMIAQHTPSASLPSGHHYHTELQNVFDPHNNNLTSTQKLLLLDHSRLGHLNFQHLQSLYRPKSSSDSSREQGEQG
jgi:hypothetical protein